MQNILLYEKRKEVADKAIDYVLALLDKDILTSGDASRINTLCHLVITIYDYPYYSMKGPYKSRETKIEELTEKMFALYDKIMEKLSVLLDEEPVSDDNVLALDILGSIIPPLLYRLPKKDKE